jgi:hypothetical protein
MSRPTFFHLGLPNSISRAAISNVLGLPFSIVYDFELHILHEILRDQTQAINMFGSRLRFPVRVSHTTLEPSNLEEGKTKGNCKGKSLIESLKAHKKL